MTYYPAVRNIDRILSQRYARLAAEGSPPPVGTTVQVSVDTPALPSFAQMLTRSSGHVDTLRTIAGAGQVLSSAARESEWRGARKMLATLHRWELIETVRTEDMGERFGFRYDTRVTDRGREFLAWLDAR